MLTPLSYLFMPNSINLACVALSLSMLVAACSSKVNEPSAQASAVKKTDKTKILVPSKTVFNVLRVIDGDTILAKNVSLSSDKENLKRIRLCGVDAPELKQPRGLNTKIKLEEILAANENQIRMTELGSDQYGRTVAEIFSGDKLVNLTLLEQGLVYISPAFYKKCPNSLAMLQAETLSKNKKVGVWSDNVQIYPWDYRKTKK